MHGVTKSQICYPFCAVPGAVEHQLWQQRTQHPSETTESILRGAQVLISLVSVLTSSRKNMSKCEIYRICRIIEGYGGTLRV